MKYALFVALLALAMAITLLALAQDEAWITDYLAYYQEQGASDSLLTRLEANIRAEVKDSTWLAEHVEIQRLIMLEYRLNKLRALVETGTPEEKAAAEAKIQELLDKEAQQ